MTNDRLAPPGGDAAPTTAPLGDRDQLDLVALAQVICRQYRAEFADEQERYGDAGDAWCVHDNQYLLCWAAESVNGHVDLNHEVTWLASVLEARNFPIDRLARNLDIGADVVAEAVSGAPGKQLAGALAEAATFVRSRETFLD